MTDLTIMIALISTAIAVCLQVMLAKWERNLSGIRRDIKH